MLAEYLRLSGLISLSVGCWLLPACYPLKKHEQGISLALALASTVALIRYSKITMEEDDYQHRYQLMQRELDRSELVYQTYASEQLIQQKYMNLSPVSEFQPEFLPETAVSNLKPLKLLPVNQFQNRKPEVSVSFQPETGVETLRNQISELRNAGLKQKQIIALIWKVKPGGSKAYKDAVDQYKQLIGES